MRENIFGSDTWSIEPCQSHSSIKSANGTKEVNNIGLVLYKCGVIKVEDKAPVVIDLSKEEAKEFAIRLLKLATDDVPERGLRFDTYSENSLYIHHSIKDGKHTNEPVLHLDDGPVGALVIALPSKTTKALIAALAKIV